MTKKGYIIPKYSDCYNCGKKLIGRQRIYCSKKCKDRQERKNNPSYRRQRNRGIKRKLKLIETKGGSCELCGYDKNISSLTFHHIDPQQKSFNVELRNIANYDWSKVLNESSKCMLLCHNCHHELHHPEFNKESLKKSLT
jgi:hypothetical protein